jgi:uncharacterized protein YdaU (DUF1376 family)
MKTRHFEGSIASWAAWAAPGRNERTQSELAAFDFTLAGNGWSNRRIARELGINRETVGKYLLLARKRGQKQKEQIQAQRTFDRRTGNLNGLATDSARFSLQLTVDGHCQRREVVLSFADVDRT